MKTCPATVLRRVWRGAVISIMTLGIFSTMTPTASAEIIEVGVADSTGRDKLAECESGNVSCTWTLVGVGNVLETPHVQFKQVGSPAKNCSSASMVQTVTWNDETKATYTFGVNIGPTNASLAFGASSETAHSEGGSTQVTVEAGRIAFIERAQIMKVYSGYFETHYMEGGAQFPAESATQYRIYVNIFKAVPDGTDGKYSTIQTTTRDLSDEEWSTC
ncbi:hypothetical protein [Nocardia sp. CA-135398]|uniref:hypothetical protein n=1 Tax=Nocardia sp. CA-135398 TaxID=3239977 RepID=UPI003D986B74